MSEGIADWTNAVHCGDSLEVLDDKTIAYLTAAGGLLGVILGVVFFVV